MVSNGYTKVGPWILQTVSCGRLRIRISRQFQEGCPWARSDLTQVRSYMSHLEELVAVESNLHAVYQSRTWRALTGVGAPNAPFMLYPPIMLPHMSFVL